MIDYHIYGTHHIGVKEFPPFIRITLQDAVRRQLFSEVLKTVGKIKRKHEVSGDFFSALYGEKKAKIFNLLFEGPQTAMSLIQNSELSSSAVYHLLSKLRSQNRIKKEGRTYILNEPDFYPVTLHELVQIEEEPDKRRKYGISVKELELAFFLWERFSLVAPDRGGYGRTYGSWYTLADAVHRWRTGRTDIPVWALRGLIDLSGPEILTRKGAIRQYHLPPGIPVRTSSNGEYKIPIFVDSTLDKVVVQLMQKMSKNHLYTFPKRKKWLFEALQERFGDFDHTASRIPSAITEILTSHYGLESLNRSSSCIPEAMKTRWAELNPVLKIEEESSLVLHIISLSSRSNGGFEITSRSKPFLQDVSYLTSDLGLGALTVRKKQSRPHFRAYLSENKTQILKRYAHLFQEYADLQFWMRIPLNRIGEKIVLHEGNRSLEEICREELSRFVSSILGSLERKKKPQFSYAQPGFTQYEPEITDYFWVHKSLPSPRTVEELVEMEEAAGEESLLYA
jgi:hypothetical protein